MILAGRFDCKAIGSRRLIVAGVAGIVGIVRPAMAYNNRAVVVFSGGIYAQGAKS